MQPIILECDRLRAAVAPHIGGAVLDFSIEDGEGGFMPIFARAPWFADHWRHTANFPLAPWSNRIQDARLIWNGSTHDIAVSAPDGTAHHGELLNTSLAITDRTPLSIRMTFDAPAAAGSTWPWRYTASVRYELTPVALDSEITVTNHSETPMPAGGGFHPFFPRTVRDSSDDVTVRTPAVGRYPMDRCLPTAEAAPDDVSRLLRAGVPLSQLDAEPGPLDDVFTIDAGETSLHWNKSGHTVTITSSDTLRHMVIYTPRDEQLGVPKPFFCVEPVSMVNNGFNASQAGMLGTGTQTLATGETLVMQSTTAISRP